MQDLLHLLNISFRCNETPDSLAVLVLDDFKKTNRGQTRRSPLRFKTLIKTWFYAHKFKINDDRV